MELANATTETERRFINEIGAELREPITPRARRLAREELLTIALHTDSAEVRALALDAIAHSPNKPAAGKAPRPRAARHG